MKIAIDARILKTGIGNYTKSLIGELVNILSPDDQLTIFLRGEDFDVFPDTNQKVKKVAVNIKPYSLSEQLIFPFILLRENPDLVHFTTFNIPILWWRKYVVTIHDLIHLKHSTFGNVTQNYLYYLFKKLIYVFVIKWVTFRAKIVVTDSFATKNDLINTLKVNHKKIKVIHLAGSSHLNPINVSIEDNHVILTKYGIVKPYLLYTATMYPHKNHERLLKAFQIIQNQRPNLNLVLVGKMDNLSTRIKNKTIEMGLENSVIFPNYQVENGYIPDKDLAVLYQNAQIYVFPSLLEGFGIPILEAQEYKLPVIAANIDCLREIGKDSILYFDPYSIEDIAKQILDLLNDKNKYQDLIYRGLENIKLFSWQKVAGETLRVYNSLINK